MITYADIRKNLSDWAESQEEHITCEDLRDTVTVVHSDGSEFRLCNAKLETVTEYDERWYIIYTEHCGHYLFCEDDLDSIHRQPMTPKGW